MRPKHWQTAFALIATALALGSVMRVDLNPLAKQIFPDAIEYSNIAQHLYEGDGYIATNHAAEGHPPQYSIGYPLVTAPFAVLGEYPVGVARGNKAAVLAYVLAIVIAAWSLGGPLGAGFAALLVLFSPFARNSAQYFMSDAFGAAVVVAMVPLMRWRTVAGDRLTGALLGLAYLVRITGGVVAAAAIFATPGGANARWRILRWFAAFVVATAALNWLTYGHPLRNGYDFRALGFGDTFHLSAPWHRFGGEGFNWFTDFVQPSLIDRIAPGPTP